MYKLKHYIGFLILLLFITGANISIARDHDTDVLDGIPQPPLINEEDTLPTITNRRTTLCAYIT